MPWVRVPSLAPSASRETPCADCRDRWPWCHRPAACARTGSRGRGAAAASRSPTATTGARGPSSPDCGIGRSSPIWTGWRRPTSWWRRRPLRCSSRSRCRRSRRDASWCRPRSVRCCRGWRWSSGRGRWVPGSWCRPGRCSGWMRCAPPPRVRSRRSRSRPASRPAAWRVPLIWRPRHRARRDRHGETGVRGQRAGGRRRLPGQCQRRRRTRTRRHRAGADDGAHLGRPHDDAQPPHHPRRGGGGALYHDHRGRAERGQSAHRPATPLSVLACLRGLVSTLKIGS